MKTYNKIANHIMERNVCKHMSRDAAVYLWKNLKAQKWSPAGNTLQKSDETSEGEFTFETKGNQVVVSYKQVEVAL